ncbi:hypothetical protein VOLCADRAFT_95795 [Volvox carteri f. nagariensis]|uniref:Uncharacterized protein n=1 Tax=Volvox carteri f. nagariensis TaxID=3068 RepID=D8U8E6_VOLCA|nr:uncharacterized protein VOLCADRAFT_95795 [Volvox carteri f. nagariensis]EFJ43963.1 hypothetical protein VOLCADRAFT_95795 [Volvox carteri f. nagariensis]|eukprot:XP_002954975.1 hypothetical protein VOLCADRAFT_95795 [Volvox carteri f. nagariensis]
MILTKGVQVVVPCTAVKVGVDGSGGGGGGCASGSSGGGAVQGAAPGGGGGGGQQQPSGTGSGSGTNVHVTAPFTTVSVVGGRSGGGGGGGGGAPTSPSAGGGGGGGSGADVQVTAPFTTVSVDTKVCCVKPSIVPPSRRLTPISLVYVRYFAMAGAVELRKDCQLQSGQRRLLRLGSLVLGLRLRGQTEAAAAGVGRRRRQQQHRSHGVSGSVSAPYTRVTWGTGRRLQSTGDSAGTADTGAGSRGLKQVVVGAGPKGYVNVGNSVRVRWNAGGRRRNLQSGTQVSVNAGPSGSVSAPYAQVSWGRRLQSTGDSAGTADTGAGGRGLKEVVVGAGQNGFVYVDGLVGMQWRGGRHRRSLQSDGGTKSTGDSAGTADTGAGSRGLKEASSKGNNYPTTTVTAPTTTVTDTNKKTTVNTDWADVTVNKGDGSCMFLIHHILNTIALLSNGCNSQNSNTNTNNNNNNNNNNSNNNGNGNSGCVTAPYTRVTWGKGCK